MGNATYTGCVAECQLVLQVAHTGHIIQIEQEVMGTVVIMYPSKK